MSVLGERLQADRVSQLWVVYHDYSGVSHAKTVPPERFAAALGAGIGFARANMDFNILDHQVPRPIFTAETGDFFAVPDPDTYAPLPYHPGTARLYSFLTAAGGDRWEGCPRGALQRLVDRYQSGEAGRALRVRAAFEPECYLFVQGARGYEPADRSRMFSVDGLDRHAALFRRLLETLGAMGIRVEQIGAEYGPGQYEINVRHAEPLRAADDLLTLKDALRSLARESGLLASFMPKPFSDLPGCGLHVHLGIEDADGRNLLGERPLGDADGDGLSDLGRAFVGGLLAHARALCGIGAPTVNSYKRLLPGSWSPAHVCYGSANRAALVRIPDAGSLHVEFRAGDNTCNPHLFLAALLAAGLDGIGRGLKAEPRVGDDVGHLSEEDAERRGLRLLPRSAAEALDALEADPVVMGALGAVIGPALLRVKRSEVTAYELAVGEWERSAYLETV